MDNSDLIARNAELEHELQWLRQRELELTDFLENASLGLHWIGPDGTILWTNQAELDLLGYSREEYLGHNIAEFHADPPVIDGILRRLSADETIRNYEVRLRCKDGSMRHVPISSNVRGEGERFVHGRCFTRDITDRKRYEQRLFAQSRVAGILAAGPSMMEATPKILQALCEALGWQVGLLWTWDAAHEVLRCAGLWRQPAAAIEEFAAICQDRAFKAGVGLPGRVWKSKQPAWISDLQSDPNFPRLAAAAANGLRAGIGFPIIHGDTIFGVMEFFGGEAPPTDEESLQMVTVIGNQIGEYLERQRTQKELGEREERYRVLTEAASDGIISIDATSAILFANTAAAHLFGYGREELIGADLTILMPEYLRHAHKTAIAQYLATGERHLSWRAVQLPGRHKDGHELSLELSFAEYKEDQKQLFIGIIRDISERKRLEEQLRQTAKLESLGLLAGGIAHDFNNLLTGIMGNISLAQETLSALHPARSSLDHAAEASERAAHLTKQLLAYAGKGRFVVQALDLSVLVREISSLVKTSIPKSVQLRLDLAERLPCVEGDPTQLQQLLMNLVINGAEAIGSSEGTVLITTHVQMVDEAYAAQTLGNKELRPGAYVSVEVHDTGSGMDAATLTQIFDPFFTTKFTGRGLGLAAALGIVRGHKGALKVYSEPGKGSTFKVLFPATGAEAASAHPQAPHADLVRSGAVLVVDDEAVVRSVARSMLERFGYTVLVAANGKQALDLVRQHRHALALILLDLTMPVMSGEEALSHIKAIDPSVPVILSSGYNEMEAIQRFAGKGLAGFLQKPYTRERLAEKLRALGAKQ
jgi:two-component system cell cycle sensor histidine kinase/response regulator CckA